MALNFIKKFADPTNYGAGRATSDIKYIVIHYTGNETDTAKANANYFANNKNLGASAHYFVDGGEYVYKSVSVSNAAYSVGKNYGSNNLFGKVTNRNSLSIEMCSKNGVHTDATIFQTIELVEFLCNKYNIPVTNVVRHYDVCSKQCPGWKGWLPGNETLWKLFKRAIDHNYKGK